MAQPGRPEKDQVKVLFEDDDVIAVDKPSGLPSHATVDSKRPHLVRAVENHLRARGGELYLAQHHRLDAGTSGVVIFSKSKRANAPLADAFRAKLAEKTYVALIECATPLPAKWLVKNHLAEDKDDRHRMRSVRSGGDRAETAFRLLFPSRNGQRALVEAKPTTGRRHQIRAHLAENGTPIVGDESYGGAAGTRLMLHALSIALPHPVTGERLDIQAPLPGDFESVLKRFGIESAMFSEK